MLQGRIALDGVPFTLELPRAPVVHHNTRKRVRYTRRLIETREKPVEVFGILEFVSQDMARVGVSADVLPKITLILEHPVDNAAEKGDVGATADRYVKVG